MKSIVILLPILAIASCGKAPPSSAPSSAEPKLVQAMKVSHGETPTRRTYSGEVRARHETTLGFRIGGKVIERLVDVGARVKPGQPIARLDPTDARLAASQAEANAALAEAELKRSQDLRGKNFVSQAALDAKETAAKSATAQAQLARNQARYTTLFADARGIIGQVLIEPGQVVTAGQPAFRLAREGEWEVGISLPETDLARVRVGTPVTVKLWADGKTLAGRVREITPVADPATRTFGARISLQGVKSPLPLGMTATVDLNAQESPRIVVPLAALFQKGERPAVWVIDKENAVSLRPVSVERYADEGAVIGSGIEAGETIVTAGVSKLTAGEKIRVAGEGRQ
jgi:RND family efflux transporter MFP subunit